MTILNTDDTAILIIDIQEKLLNAIFNKDIVAKKSEILVKAANILSIPTFVTEQYPQGLGSTVDSIKFNLSVDTKFYEKTTFNALTDDTLKNDIKNTNAKNIFIAGIETHICVHQTVNALINTGYRVTVLKDCCGSRSEFEYNSALETMKDYGAKIKTTEMVLFELLKTAKHPNFKEIQALVK